MTFGQSGIKGDPGDFRFLKIVLRKRFTRESNSPKIKGNGSVYVFAKV